MVVLARADLYKDAAGGGRTVPVDIYVGGHVVYLARNETAAPVEMAVTYMFADGVSHASFRCLLSVPANCHFH